MAWWVPFGRISVSQSFAFFLVLVALWTVVLIATVYCLLLAAREAWRARRLDSRAVLSAALLATVLEWSALGFSAVYEATFAIPMMVLAAVLALSTFTGYRRFARAIKVLAGAIGVLGMVSVALVAALYGPPLADAAGQRGYIEEQRYSISAFGFSRLRRDILGAARKCGITDPDHQHALAVDDLTYFPFMKSRLPQHRGGLFVPALARDPMDYLRAIKSDGIMASCQVLPPELRARAKRQGQFCCVAPEDF
jgi:hypothetical protein